MLLISIFSYYPIFKALPIAFQDYSVTGLPEWVGAANFVEVSPIRQRGLRCSKLPPT